MRVWHVHVSPRLAPVNGVVQSLHRLAAAQRGIGAEVEVFHGTLDDPRNAAQRGRAATLAADLRRAGAHGRPDVVHLHEPFHPPHLVARRMLRDVPVVLTLHGALAPASLRRSRLAKAGYGALVERAAVAAADRVIVHSEVEAGQARAYARAVPTVALVPNAADPRLLDHAGWAEGDAIPGRLVSLSRWDVRHKGLDRVAAIAEHAPELDVRLHGEPCGNDPEVLALLMASAPENVVFAPPVLGPAKVPALLAADAFVLLSRWEGQAMALLEALALGVPCIVSEEVAATLDHPPVLCVLPRDRRAAATAIRKLLADRTALADLGTRGRDWVRRTATPDRIAELTLDVYRQAGAGSPRRQGASR